MNPIALMTDAETLGLTPDSHVLQVAFVVVDLRTGDRLRKFSAQPPNHQAGRRIDPDTVRWWIKQDPTVAREVFALDVPLSADTIRAAFASAIADYDPDVWANPSTFDLPLLASLFRNSPPWKYNRERCLKTAVDILDPNKELRPPDNSSPHNALADAEWQVDYLVRLYAKQQELLA